MDDTVINYDLAYQLYTKQIKRMAVGSIKRTGIKKTAKPMMLLAVIKGIEKGVIKNNRIEYAQIEPLYKVIFEQYEDMARQTERTPAYYPFYHLHTSSFWHLSLLSAHSMASTSSPSEAWVRNNVAYAYLDTCLWNLLQREEYRQRLTRYIIEEKMRQHSLPHILHTFIGWLVAI